MARLSHILLVAAAACQASGKIIPIKLINDVFEPNTTTAAVGDILEFHFVEGNHSVVMGDFSDACQPAKTGGFYSGFFAVQSESPQVFRVPINDTNPAVYYCSQGRYGGGHCQIGMVGVINPADSSALPKYAEAAKTVLLANSPAGGPFGGTFAANPNMSSASSSSPTGSLGSTATTGAPTSASVTAGAGSVVVNSLDSAIAAGAVALLMAL